MDVQNVRGSGVFQPIEKEIRISASMSRPRKFHSEGINTGQFTFLLPKTVGNVMAPSKTQPPMNYPKKRHKNF